ncbi:Ig-like domain repeat protein [Corynebacterium aquatimens]|uniref:Ig-like domain repeat protein n=1 Tax=Corynebacterium aquatimens TaxID=1190508 RepID=UPI00361B5DD4
MPKRFPFRTAIAGLTALAIASPVVAPVNTSLLAAAVAQVREDLSTRNKLVFKARPNTPSDNPAEVAYRTEGTFSVQVPNPEPNSKVQFFLDGVAQGEPVAITNGYASITVKPTSFTTDAFKHVVTARYVDPNGFNVRADVTKEFATKLTEAAVPKEVKSQNITDEEIRDNRYSFTINGSSKTDSNPLALKQGQEFTLTGSNSFSGRGFTNVWEIGLNPPSGTEFVSAKRTDRTASVAYQGADSNGVGIRVHQDADGNWGVPGNPKANPGNAFITFRPDDFKMYNAQKAEVEGKFKAPQTPGIYYPQFAIFKYTGITGGNKTRYMHRMDTAVFRVTSPELPERYLRKQVTVALAPEQKLQATVDGTLVATVSPKASGTVTFIRPGSNGTQDEQLGTAGIVNGEAKLYPVNFETHGEQDIKLKFIPAQGTDWAESEGTGQVYVEHAPAQATSITLTLPSETVQGVKFDASASVDQKVDGTIQFYSVVEEQGTKIDVKYGEPIPVNEANDWTAKVQPQLFKLGLQTAKAVFTPNDTKAYKGSEKTQDIYIKQPTTTITLSAEEGKKVGEDVKITAKIDPAVAGTIVFTDGDKALDTKSVAAGTSEVTITKSFNTAGSHALKAVFTPLDNVTYPTAESTTNLVIGDRNKIDTTLELRSDKSELTVGESAIVTAKVPTGVEGRVMFDDGTGVQAFAPVDPATGEAKFTYIPRTDGKKTVQAEFVPINASAATHNGTTKSVDITVKAASSVNQDTNLVLTGPKSVTEGDSITLTAFVNPRGATGTVQFSDGTGPIGEAVTIKNGKAEITVPNASLGDYQYMAAYNPTGAFNATLPATHAVKVNPKPAPVTNTVTATATPSTVTTTATTTKTEPTTTTKVESTTTTETTTVEKPTTITSVTTKTEPTTTTKVESTTTTETTTVEKPTTITSVTTKTEPTTTTKVESTTTTETTTTTATPSTVTTTATTTKTEPTTTTKVESTTTTETTTTTATPSTVTTTATTTKTEPTTTTKVEPTTTTATTTVEKPTTVTSVTTKTEPTTTTKVESTTTTATTTVEKPTTATATTTVGEVTKSTTATTTETKTDTTTVEKPTTLSTTVKETATETVEKPTTVVKPTTVTAKETVTTKETATERATTTVDRPTTVTEKETVTTTATNNVTTTQQVPGATGTLPAPAVDASKVVETPAGRDVTLTASTTPGTKGEIVFVTKDGQVLGKAPIGKDGTAKLTHSFTTPGSYEIQSYVQAPDGTKGQKSPSFTVTVADKGGSSVKLGAGSADSSSTDNKTALYAGIGVLLAFLLGAISIALLGHPAVKKFFASIGIHY